MAVIGGITAVALVLTLFMLFFLLFGYSRINTGMTMWLIIIILFIYVFSAATTARRTPDWPTQPSLLLANYTVKPPLFQRPG
jgi:hypothetical protein